MAAVVLCMVVTIRLDVSSTPHIIIDRRFAEIINTSCLAMERIGLLRHGKCMNQIRRLCLTETLSPSLPLRHWKDPLAKNEEPVFKFFIQPHSHLASLLTICPIICPAAKCCCWLYFLFLAGQLPISLCDFQISSFRSWRSPAWYRVPPQCCCS